VAGVAGVALVPVPEPEPVPLMPLEPDMPVPLAPVLPLMPLVPDEPDVLEPAGGVVMEPVPVGGVVVVPVPMLPLVPEVPDEPDVPCISWLPLDDVPLLVEPLLLEPVLMLLELLFLWCFFLLCFLWVGVADVAWSCAVALLPVAELLVCAWAFIVPNIATVTAAPSRPFNNLFIFMSLSKENVSGAKNSAISIRYCGGEV
jgi:signal-induced proliferation-associated 1 like protein 3